MEHFRKIHICNLPLANELRATASYALKKEEKVKQNKRARLQRKVTDFSSNPYHSLNHEPEERKICSVS
jgi:hypothetical protein